MIRVLDMRQFMHYHIVDHIRRGHHQPPGETQVSFSSTRPPPPPRARDAHIAAPDARRCRVLLRSSLQILTRPSAVPGSEDVAGVGDILIGQQEPVPVELYRHAVPSVE